MTDIVVTQADRDAAADHMSRFYGDDPDFWREAQWAETMIRLGKGDTYPLVQAFARHRQPAAEEVERLREALIAAESWLEYDLQPMGPAEEAAYWRLMHRIKAAITGDQP